VAAGIAALAIDGVWWPQVPHGLDPLARPAPPRDARWQRGAAADALYLAESPETTWAEWYRWLAEYGVPPRAALPRDLWRIEIALEGVADLRSAVTLASLGLSAPLPGRNDWPAFQAVGERLAATGLAALLAPSAARTGGEVLCIFWPPQPPSRVRAVGSPETLREPPAPPRGLRT